MHAFLWVSLVTGVLSALGSLRKIEVSAVGLIATIDCIFTGAYIAWAIYLLHEI